MNTLKFLPYILLSTLLVWGGCEQTVSIQDNTPPPDNQSNRSVSVQKSVTLKPELASGRYIVVFKEQNNYKISPQAAQQATENTQAIIADLDIRQESIIHQYKYALKGFAAKLTDDQVEQLKKDPRIETVAQDIRYKAVQVSSSSSTYTSAVTMAQTTPWGVTRVGGPLNGTGKKAWILDTGIDLDHPDLNVDISNSASFYALESADDLNGHGTHVAGIIAAKNNSIGTVGVAAGASVVAVKVCDSGGWCYTSDLKAGIDHVSSNYTSGDVANISLGWPVSGHPYIDLALSILENTIKSAADDGLLFTVAAGNSNQHANSVSPGRINYPNVYVVSAHNSNDVFAGFSNYGNPPIKYSNPGVNILSLWKNGGTETADGTSMAAPHVAGLLLAMGKEPYTNKYVSGDPDNNPDPIAASQPYVETPIVIHSVQNHHPKLNWQVCEGADEYKVYRKVNSSGNWDLWATTSSNSYVDMLTTNPNLVALSGGPNGPTGWVAYKVKSVHDDGFNSNESSVKYFEFNGIIIE